MKTPRLYIILLSSLLVVNVYAQVGVDENVHKKILSKNQKEKVFVFDNTKGDIADKTSITYLGDITSKQGRTFKIITSIWIWGYSKRGTTKIMIFDNKNNHIGDFVLEMTYESPTKVDGSKLIFEFPENESCEHKIKREISFIDGIPNQFFLECKNGLGDLYLFNASKNYK